MRTYFLTFKTLKEQFPTAMMYMDAFAIVLGTGKNIVVVKNAFEVDTTNKLHFHAIVMARYIRFAEISDLLFANDMYFNFRELKAVEDVRKATNYLCKCSKDPYLHEQKYYTQGIVFDDDILQLMKH